MTEPLTLPCDRATLCADVARLWPDAARNAGCGARTVPWVSEGGHIGGRPGHPVDPVGARGVDELACALEDLGYAVVREGGARVVGWAAAETWERLDPPRPWPGKTVLVRLIDLPPTDPRRDAWRTRILAERQARRESPAANAKLTGARARHRAAYGRR